MEEMEKMENCLDVAATLWPFTGDTRNVLNVDCSVLKCYFGTENDGEKQMEKHPAQNELKKWGKREIKEWINFL
jgi:hypothetical protein